MLYGDVVAPVGKMGVSGTGNVVEDVVEGADGLGAFAMVLVVVEVCSSSVGVVVVVVEVEVEEEEIDTVARLGTVGLGSVVGA